MKKYRKWGITLMWWIFNSSAQVIKSVVDKNFEHVVVSEKTVINLTWPYIAMQLNSIIYIDNV